MFTETCSSPQCLASHSPERSGTDVNVTEAFTIISNIVGRVANKVLHILISQNIITSTPNQDGLIKVIKEFYNPRT